LVAGALKMVEEDKIKTFDVAVCEALLSRKQSVEEYLSQPSLINSGN
jgi:hypothetical protein